MAEKDTALEQLLANAEEQMYLGNKADSTAVYEVAALLNITKAATDLSTVVNNLINMVATEATLSAINGKVATDASISELDSKVATATNQATEISKLTSLIDLIGIANGHLATIATNTTEANAKLDQIVQNTTPASA